MPVEANTSPDELHCVIVILCKTDAPKGNVTVSTFLDIYISDESPPFLGTSDPHSYIFLTPVYVDLDR